MSESTSNFIVIVISTIIACFLITSFLYVFNARYKVNNAKETAQAQMDISNQNKDLIQYAGSTISGEKLVALLKECDGTDATIKLRHKDATDAYMIFTFSKVGTQSFQNGSETKTVFYESGNKNSVSALIEKADSRWYISPFIKFYCNADTDPTTGIITGLTFVEQ